METLVYSRGTVYQTPSGNASGSPAATRSAAKRQPDGDGQQEHVADDGGDHAAGGRAAEAAARDVESAHGRGGGGLLPSAAAGPDSTAIPETGTDTRGRSGSSHVTWTDFENAPASRTASDTERTAEPFGGIRVADSSAVAPQHALTRDTETAASP
jgi:hypothetical protein